MKKYLKPLKYKLNKYLSFIFENKKSIIYSILGMLISFLIFYIFIHYYIHELGHVLNSIIFYLPTHHDGNLTIHIVWGKDTYFNFFNVPMRTIMTYGPAWNLYKLSLLGGASLVVIVLYLIYKILSKNEIFKNVKIKKLTLKLLYVVILFELLTQFFLGDDGEAFFNYPSVIHPFIVFFNIIIGCSLIYFVIPFSIFYLIFNILT